MYKMTSDPNRGEGYPGRVLKQKLQAGSTVAHMPGLQPGTEPGCATLHWVCCWTKQCWPPYIPSITASLGSLPLIAGENSVASLPGIQLSPGWNPT